MERTPEFNMLSGLQCLNRLVANRWETYGEALVLFSGPSGSGKTTLIDICNDTNFGGLIPEQYVSSEEEVTMDQTFSFNPKDSDPPYTYKIQGEVFVSGMLSTAYLQDNLVDPRLITVGLKCNPLTLFLNNTDFISEWKEESIRLKLPGGPLVHIARSIFRCTYPQIKNTINKHDLIINTSIGRRISSKQATHLI